MNINNIMQRGKEGTAHDRAEDAWARIQDKPTDVVLVRNQVSLDPQTVRIEWNNSATNTNESKGAGGSSSKRFGTLFGFKDHPTIPDTDVKRNDKFHLDLSQYKILSVMFGVGEKQAAFEVMD